MEAEATRMADGHFNRLFRIFDYNGIQVSVPRYVYRMATAGLRMWPSFLIIGEAKAGTTSLLAYLAQHPDVVEPMRKEVHFFNMHYRVGPTFYRSNFPFEEEGKMTGEATPDYLCHPHCPGRVTGLLPDRRLIAILRNPIDRAYSHYQMMVRGGRETETFQRAIDLEPQRALVHIERLERDPDYWRGGMFSYAYLYRGRYMDHLENWLDHVRREDLLVLTFDDLARDPEAVFGRMLDHIGLDWPKNVDIDFTPRNPGRYDNLSPETRADLLERFEEDNARLFEFLGKDLDWS